ncbi:MAG: BatD family protein [Lentisphaerota bacterium]
MLKASWFSRSCSRERLPAFSRRMGPSVMAIIGLLLLTVNARAFDVAFDLQPRVLRVGEAATASFTVMGLQNPPTPEFPKIQGVQINYAGTEQSFSIGAGGQNNSVTFRFQVFPTQTGKFTLGPFVYTAGGQSAQIGAVEFEVIAPDQAQSGDGQGASWSELLFARVSVDRPKIYNQQVFNLTFSIYSRGINLARDINLINMPASGFNVASFQELQATREVVNNQVYDVRRFRGKAQALTAGSFKLEPILRAAVVVPRERRQSRGVFDDPFFDNPFFNPVQTQPVDLKTEPIDVVILSLPSEGQPPGFAGAVGRFNFDVQAKPLDLNVGDPVTLNMLIAGEGNIEASAAPHIQGDDNFKLYEPKMTGKEIDEATSTGRKMFEQVIIPKTDTVKELPALTFAYFDPDKERYETITRGPFPLTVHPSASGNAKLMQLAADQSPQQTVLLGADIIYLKPAPSHWSPASSGSWFTRKPLLAAQVLPALCVMGLALYQRRRKELASDVAKARRQKAPRSAQAAMKKAETALSRGDRSQYFEALWEAAASYFGHRLNLAPGQVDMERVGEAMTRGGLEAGHLQFLQDLFKRCDRERFAASTASGGELPEQEKEELAAMLERMMQILKACEKIRL